MILTDDLMPDGLYLLLILLFLMAAAYSLYLDERKHISEAFRDREYVEADEDTDRLSGLYRAAGDPADRALWEETARELEQEKKNRR